jgi:hypothetical protein
VWARRLHDVEFAADRELDNPDGRDADAHPRRQAAGCCER